MIMADLSVLWTPRLANDWQAWHSKSINAHCETDWHWCHATAVVTEDMSQESHLPVVVPLTFNLEKNHHHRSFQIPGLKVAGITIPWCVCSEERSRRCWLFAIKWRSLCRLPFSDASADRILPKVHVVTTFQTNMCKSGRRSHPGLSIVPMLAKPKTIVLWWKCFSSQVVQVGFGWRGFGWSGIVASNLCWFTAWSGIPPSKQLLLIQNPCREACLRSPWYVVVLEYSI